MRALALLLAAQLADLAAYLLVGRPDDSVLQAIGAPVAAAKLAGIVAVALLLALLRRRRPSWAHRGTLLVALVGLVGAASGIRMVLA